MNKATTAPEARQRAVQSVSEAFQDIDDSELDILVQQDGGDPGMSREEKLAFVAEQSIDEELESGQPTGQPTDTSTETSVLSTEAVSETAPEAQQQLLTRLESTYGVKGKLVEAPDKPGVQDIVNLAQQLGVEVGFYQSDDGGQQWSGFGEKGARTVLFNADAAELGDAGLLWKLAYHEFSHATGVDITETLDAKLVEEHAKKYEQRLRDAGHTEAADAFAKNPEMRRQEGGAVLIEEFATNPKFRAAIEEQNPTLFKQLMEFLRNLFANFEPKSQAMQDVVKAFRAQIEQQGPRGEGDVLASPGTPAFDRWFGDSKVVDDNGKPLVVYHGTVGDFREFSKAIAGSSTKA